MERMSYLDLSKKSTENIAYMMETIKSKLRVVNAGALKASDIDENMYDELKDIYEMVNKKDQFSISEMEAIASELGNLRK